MRIRRWAGIESIFARRPHQRRWAIATAAGTSVHKLEIPTPFAVGAVNAYLIEDAPLTLIDPGPASTAALEALEDALAARGHSVGELELLLITHQHLDHSGLAAYLASRSAAKVGCLDRLAPYLESFEAMVDAEDAAAAELMRRHGVPHDLVDVIRSLSTVARRWGASVAVDVPLADGSTVELGDRSLRVVHAPGHSPSDTLFVDEARGMLFAGDHLLPDTSSNALVASRLPDTPEKPWYPALRTYRESLAVTRALDVDLVLPGHGEPLTGHRALIDDRFAQHEQRLERILAAIRKRPSSAHELARELWGDRSITQAYLTVSEVLGHVDLLVDRGLVSQGDANGVVRWHA